MTGNIIVIGLVPPPDFARFLRELRARYPEAKLTAVIGNKELQAVATQGAEECLLWSSMPARALLNELRQRQALLIAVPYNPEYAITRTYWKALMLASLARAKSLLFCERARLPENDTSLHRLSRPLIQVTTILSAIGRAIGRRIARFVSDIVIILVSSPLLLVLLGIILIDLANVLTGGSRGAKRNLRAAR